MILFLLLLLRINPQSLRGSILPAETSSLSNPNYMYRQKISDCCDLQKLESSFLNILDEADFNILNRHKTCSFYKKGQIIFNEGNSPYGLYFLDKGKVKLWRETVFDKEIIINLIKEGDLFGYRSLLSNDFYKASATAIEDSIICFFYKEDFVEVMNRNTKIVQHMLFLIGQDMGIMAENMGSMAHKSIRERVAEKLLMLRNNFGLTQDGRIIIDILLSRQELANIIGTSSEQTSFFLSDFKKEGIIAFTEDKKIQILKLEQLIAISNMYSSGYQHHLKK